MGRIVAELDEDGNRHPELEPLDNIGRWLACHRVDDVASQNHSLTSTGSHKLWLLTQIVGTCKTRGDTMEGPC